MTTLRANKGKTSSSSAFWLMPAMRRNDRSGPGMVASSTGVAAACGPAELAVCACIFLGETENREAARRRTTNDFMEKPSFGTREPVCAYVAGDASNQVTTCITQDGLGWQ